MQQKVNATWLGLSSTECGGSAGLEAGWGRAECEEAKAWCQPAGRREKDGAERSQPGTEAGTRQAAASLRKRITEDGAQGTRSSEAARGVLSRIMKKSFPSSF